MRASEEMCPGGDAQKTAIAAGSAPQAPLAPTTVRQAQSFPLRPPDERIASLPRQALQPQWLFERHAADKEKPATQDGAVQIASQAATNAWQAVSTAHRNALEAARNDVSPIRARSQVQEAKSASAPPSCVANWILS